MSRRLRIWLLIVAVALVALMLISNMNRKPSGKGVASRSQVSEFVDDARVFLRLKAPSAVRRPSAKQLESWTTTSQNRKREVSFSKAFNEGGAVVDLVGRVTDEAGTALGGVAVNLLSEPVGVVDSPKVLTTATTDSGGRFAFGKISISYIGSYAVSANHRGYAPRQELVTSNMARNKQIDVTLVLLPSHRVSGTVVDSADMSPIADAMVRLTDAYPPVMAVSGADGRFVLENAPTTFTVQCRKEGYSQQLLVGQRVSLANGETNPDDVKIYLSQGSVSVAGVLLDHERNPIPYYPVYAQTGSTDHAETRVRNTDERGNFLFENLLPGDLMLNSKRHSMTCMKNLKLNINDHLTGVELEFPKSVTVYGKAVRHDDKSPIPGIRINGQITDDKGCFILQKQYSEYASDEVKRLTITVEEPGWIATNGDKYGSPHPLGVFTTYYFNIKDEHLDEQYITLELKPVPGVVCTVVEPGGNPARDVFFSAHFKSPSMPEPAPAEQAFVEDDGVRKYVFNLPENFDGDVLIHAVSASKRFSGEVVVYLKPTQKVETLEIELQPRSPAPGQVVLTDGSPLSDALISWAYVTPTEWSAGNSTTKTDVDGTFRIWFVPWDDVKLRFSIDGKQRRDVPTLTAQQGELTGGHHTFVYDPTAKTVTMKRSE